MLSAGTNAAIQEYKNIDTRSRVDDASPHRLIQLMMERTLLKIGLARSQMLESDVEHKGNNITDAISVINGLQASLNHKADKQMSENFDALYAYMMRRLLEANLANDTAILDEVSGLLGEIKEAWDAIADSTNEEDDNGL